MSRIGIEPSEARNVDHSTASSTGEDVLVDTRQIQAKLEAWTRNSKGLQVFKADFVAPHDHSKGAFKSEARKKVTQWLSTMSRKGWELVQHPQIMGPLGFGHDLSTGTVLLDTGRYEVLAVFRYTRTPVTTRIELPSEMVKQEQDHELLVGTFEPRDVATKWSE
jgi:hypothetical protein